MAASFTLLDDFNRSDGAIGASWTVPWYTGDGNLEISSNQARGTAAAFSDGWWNSGDQPLETGAAVQVPTIGGGGYVFVRGNNEGTNTVTDYEVNWDGSGNLSLWYAVNGSYTQLSTVSGATISAGDIIGLIAFGNGSTITIKVYRDSGGGLAEIHSFDHTAGDRIVNPGVVGCGVSSNTTRLDSFGTLVDVAVDQPYTPPTDGSLFAGDQSWIVSFGALARASARSYIIPADVTDTPLPSTFGASLLPPMMYSVSDGAWMLAAYPELIQDEPSTDVTVTIDQAGVVSGTGIAAVGVEVSPVTIESQAGYGTITISTGLATADLVAARTVTQTVVISTGGAPVSVSADQARSSGGSGLVAMSVGMTTSTPLVSAARGGVSALSASMAQQQLAALGSALADAVSVSLAGSATAYSRTSIGGSGVSATVAAGPQTARTSQGAVVQTIQLVPLIGIAQAGIGIFSVSQVVGSPLGPGTRFVISSDRSRARSDARSRAQSDRSQASADTRTTGIISDRGDVSSEG